MRSENPPKPDHVLEIDVLDTLDWDPELDDRRITVKADDGNVTLAGSVPTYFHRLRAEDDAWSVGGVRSLHNDLLVGPIGEAIDDAQIADACRGALDHDRFVPKGAVTVEVTDGHVRLRGHVRSGFQRHAAERAVGQIEGVLWLENLIAISPEPIPSDIAARINKAFKRSALIDDSQIVVFNDGHTITLTGVVGSYAAMREAVDTAWNAPGVEMVVNHLVVEP